MIVVATTEELKLIRDGYRGQILITGKGGDNVMRAMKALPRDLKITNIGYATSKAFDEGDVVEVAHSRLLHPNLEYDDVIYELVDGDGAICYTTTDVVMDDPMDSENSIYDLELGFIMGLGFTNVKAYKYIRNDVDGKES